MEAITMQDMIDYAERLIDTDSHREWVRGLQETNGNTDEELVELYMRRADEISDAIGDNRSDSDISQFFSGMQARSHQFVEADNWMKVVRYAAEVLS